MLYVIHIQRKHKHFVVSSFDQRLLTFVSVISPPWRTLLHANVQSDLFVVFRTGEYRNQSLSENRLLIFEELVERCCQFNWSSFQTNKWVIWIFVKTRWTVWNTVNPVDSMVVLRTVSNCDEPIVYLATLFWKNLFTPFFQIILLSLLFIRFFLNNYCIENQGFIGEIYRFVILTPVVNVLTEGSLFLWLLLNVSINPKAFFTLRSPILNRLGEMSYGIYMYQMLVIFAVVLVFKKIMLQMDPSVSSVFFYILVTLGVIGVSFLSKRYFEDWFLKFKKKFE